MFGRLAGYEDVNDAERLARDPAVCAIVGRDGFDRAAASSSQMGRFETRWLATDANLAALTDLSGTWIDRVHAQKPPQPSFSTWTARRARPMARKARSGTVTSAAPVITRCSCSTSAVAYGPAISIAYGPANLHSAEDWRLVLEPVIARYRERGLDLYFRADAAFAKPEVYEPFACRLTRCCSGGSAIC